MMQWWNSDMLVQSNMMGEDESKNGMNEKKKHTEVETSEKDSPKRKWQFKVKVDLNPGEVICVTGNSVSLGLWVITKARKLCRTDEENIYSGMVDLPANRDVEYRYAVCSLIEPEVSHLDELQCVVRHWETFTLPRVAKTNNEGNGQLEVYGYHNGVEKVGRGWLTCANIIQFKLLNNPIQLWKKKLQGRKIFVKVTPVELKKNVSHEPQCNATEDGFSMETSEAPASSDKWPIIEVAVLNQAEHKLHRQDQFGQPYCENDFILFQAQVLFPETIAFLIDYYTYPSNGEEPPYHVGFSHIMPSSMKASEGQIDVPIVNVRHQPIGEIKVDYLVIKPLKDFDCSTQGTRQNEWKESWTGLDVGHRGSGSSFKPEQQKCADVRENTIASLKSAASHGADFVEFDVQLSRDLVPVLYHDFYVCISTKKKTVDDGDMLQLPVKDLSLEQLHLLKLFNLQEGKQKNSKQFSEDTEEHQPFPTLQQALEVLDPSVGFNVEIKWNMKLKDGTNELNNPLDLNLFLDCVLKVVLTYADTRPIVFSCFHPDICTMIQLKQNRYPVMFLTQCITPKYPAYYDPRCQSIPMAVHFAVSTGLLGINVHTEELLRDPSQMELVKSAGLVLFCWGDDNNNSDTIRHLKELGLHGVIYGQD
ncbi:hypothetical protein LSTR_LSTR004859 [Laodelphax striatellus]|uniref:GP-PDE domain-containing protein n=1 Tax=Laodelphax striatellus TaxID=195883 RepID=A0A482WI50_LAOST|nr:hypothetical protein LSTR_LSTR004859 [Laodelphax striatellus]